MYKKPTLTAVDLQWLRLASLFRFRLPCQIANGLYYLRDRYRQFRALAADEELRQVVLSPERAPIEGSRFSIGDVIHANSFPGLTRRLKICGVLSGGFSNVYIVIDLDEMKPYCLKENRALLGEERKRNAALEIEAKIIFTIGQHPHLATPVSAFYFDDRLLILSEYVSGYSLDYRLKNGPLDLATALRYAVHICRAVSYSQSVLPGFVHGDIKPSNCLITRDGDLKLTDFGQASAKGIGKDEWVFEEGNASHHHSGWGGTRSYMAPEMFDDLPTRKASDIYAFGITLFEMIAGTRPFSAESKSELRELHKNADPPLVLLKNRDAPEGLINLISRCLGKDPMDRPANFVDAEKELTEIASNEFGFTFGGGGCERPNPTLEQALSYAALSDHDLALKSLDRVSSETTTRAEKFAYEALILDRAGLVSQGLAASASALEFDERSYIALYSRARSLFSSSKDKEAELNIDLALRGQPSEPAALDLKGQILALRGKPKRAIGYFRASLLFDKTRIEPYRQLARTYLELGNYDRCIQIAKRGLKTHSEDAELLRILGKACFSKRQFVESIDSLKNSLRIEPDSHESRKELVRSCMGLHGSFGFKRELRIVKVLLGVTRACRSDSDVRSRSKPTADLLDLLRESPASPLLLYYLDEAVISLSETMNAVERQAFIDVIGTALVSQEARAVTAYTLGSLGKLLYQFEDYPNCVKAFSRVIREYGPDERAYYYLGVCSEVSEDLEKALEYYEKGLRLDRNSELLRTSACRVRSQLESSKVLLEGTIGRSSVNNG